MKQFIRKLVGDDRYKKMAKSNLKQTLTLARNFFYDFSLYKTHSSAFGKDNFEKLESEIILRYHSIEKGFLHEDIRLKFAKIRVLELIDLLKHPIIDTKWERSQIQAAVLNLIVYFDFHKDRKVDISDYFSEEDYLFLISKLTLKSAPTIEHSSSDYFSSSKADFQSFSASRCSVRHFNDKVVEITEIEKVIELANNAPTVCNRQGITVNLIHNKDMIDKLLKIQGGLTGYAQSCKQLIVISANRNYFYTVGERSQFYIDGGIYLMNLLYAFHYHEIAACPAHWGLSYESDIRAHELLGISPAEKIICVVAFGYPVQLFKSTLSLRRSSLENLRILE